MDGLWDRGSFRSKELIAAELVEKESALRSDFIGKFVHRKVIAIGPMFVLIWIDGTFRLPPI